MQRTAKAIHDFAQLETINIMKKCGKLLKIPQNWKGLQFNTNKKIVQ